MHGILVISLDFELFWGVRDHRTINNYGENLLGVWSALPRLLHLFAHHRIHATWATVGLLQFENPQETLAYSPDNLPTYNNSNLSPYPDIQQLIQSAPTKPSPYHFAPQLVAQILQTPGQELGSHTFSHYYCLEQGQTPIQFAADLAAAQQTAQQTGEKITMKSIVFPRNQYDEQYIALCRQAGFEVYRGNEQSWAYSPRARAKESIFRRAFRFTDAYFNLSGHNGYAPNTIPTTAGCRNVPSSRFLRPYNPRLRFAEKKRLKRICNDLTHCAKKGLMYHLWWHPHNFGAYQAENFDFLLQILVHFEQLRQQYGMKSCTMYEAANWLYDVPPNISK